MPDFYAVALLIVFYALIVAEIFIPSGGLIGAVSLVVAITSVIIGFTASVSFGMTLLLVYLLTTPVLFTFVLYLWPKTPIGRLMLNRDAIESGSAPSPPVTLDGVPLETFVGRFGHATSDLLPNGQVKIDGHKTVAVSTGLPIDEGQRVKVVRVLRGKLQVRQATADEAADVESQNQSISSAPSNEPENPHSSSSALEEIDLEDIS